MVFGNLRRCARSAAQSLEQNDNKTEASQHHEAVWRFAFGGIAASNDFPIHVCAELDNWYDELDLVWRQQRAPIAGLTRHGPLFRLERFAWERGMRVVFRGEHLWSRDCICHSLSGRREAVAKASGLIAAGADWAEALAVSVAFAKPEGRPGNVAFESVGELSCNEPLYSWVIG